MKKIRSYLSFIIGTENYAVNVRAVLNIIEYTRITRVPNMPDYMLGVINLRGRVLPVVDSRIKFGISSTEITDNTCILVMEVNVEGKIVFVGVLVDGVTAVLEIDDVKVKDSPKIGSKVKNDFIDGLYHDDDKFIMILNMNRILSKNEIDSISELTSDKA